MTRRRWIQDRVTGELVEVTDDYVATPRNAHTSDGVLWGDRSYDGMRATDGADISSRTKHREYMKAHGVTTVDDFKGTWEQRRKEREQVYTTGGDHRARREQVARALYESMNARRK